MEKGARERDSVGDVFQGRLRERVGPGLSENKRKKRNIFFSNVSRDSALDV